MVKKVKSCKIQTQSPGSKTQQNKQVECELKMFKFVPNSLQTSLI